MKRLENSDVLVVVILSLLLCLFVTMASAAETALYVSPKGNDSWAGDSIDRSFATIQKARDAVRAMKKKSALTKPVTVYIRGGLYELSETLVFTLEDSGTRACPITYTAYKDEKPIISGGRKITGPWKDYKGEIKVCTIPAVKDGKWWFRQLFLRGKRQIRSRIPNEEYYRIQPTDEELGKDSFKYRETDIKKWHNLNDVEIVLFHSWNESLLFISELNEEDRIVTFTGQVGRSLDQATHANRYYIENVLEGLDRPGEWYLDRHAGKLYYWPVDESRLSELRAPVINQLVRLQGSFKDKKYVEYINMTSLTFSDAAFTLPAEGIPTLPDVGDIYPPSAITFEAARFCTFKDSAIRNVGTYALEVNGDGNKIIGNEIYDTGSGGIITRSFGKERNEYCYNHIHDCGRILHSGVGINIEDGGGLIAHNSIHDITHTGVYGRHFTTKYMLDVFPQERERRNQQQGLIIEYNEIYNVMQIMNDGGGIFIRDDKIVIRNNLIHDVYSHNYSHPDDIYFGPPLSFPLGHPGWGIYLGCDTRNAKVESNIVYRATVGLHVWHGQKNNVIENNIFVDVARAQTDYTNPSDLQHEKVRFLRNIIYLSSPDVVLYRFMGEERSLPMESDYNIFYTKGKDMVITGLPGVDTFEDWQKRGFDTHSIVADPLFTDPENDDYSLRPESPALKLGFKPIDLSRVGLKGVRTK
ncbi:right-handed parallel beta-helix repeat-containing protein [Planctomycetota bacterium]